MGGFVHRVLVFDKDDLIRGLAGEWLSAAGYDVQLAPNLADARAAADGGRGLSLIIADLQKPRQDGLEIVRTLRAAHAGVPVVATSAFFHSGLGGCTDAARRLEVAGVLAKPYSREQLTAIARSVLRDSAVAEPGNRATVR